MAGLGVGSSFRGRGTASRETTMKRILIAAAAICAIAGAASAQPAWPAQTSLL